MISGLLASARRWAATAGLAVAVTVPSFTGSAIAAPFVPMPQVAAPAAETGVVQVGERRWRRGRGYGRDRAYYRGFREGRRHYRRGRGRDFGGLALGLGVGVPLGAYLASRPAYGGYYDPYYDRPYYRDRYVVRRVAPRPVYRGGGGSHTDWCYSRYRSYRAYDNTFQPYNGSRQQCYSPYS